MMRGRGHIERTMFELGERVAKGCRLDGVEVMGRGHEIAVIRDDV